MFHVGGSKCMSAKRRPTGRVSPSTCHYFTEEYQLSLINPLTRAPLSQLTRVSNNEAEWSVFSSFWLRNNVEEWKETNEPQVYLSNNIAVIVQNIFSNKFKVIFSDCHTTGRTAVLLNLLLYLDKKKDSAISVKNLSLKPEKRWSWCRPETLKFVLLFSPWMRSFLCTWLPVSPSALAARSL